MTTSPTGLANLGSRISRLSSGFGLLIAASLLAVLQAAAWAQAPLDPPGRVARFSLTEGAVSFAPADSTAWTPAVLNRPLTGGDRLWTGPRARSELHIGSTAVRMNEQTSLDFLALDDNVTQLRLAQGTLQLRVRTLFEGQRLEVDTPNLAFVISQPGDYRLDVTPASDTTRVVTQSGSGVIYGDSGSSVNLDSQQQVSFTGTQLTPAAPGAALQDGFDAWAEARDRREDQSISARYVPRETIGYQQLDAYGDWRQDPTYGAVWLPRAVPVYWAPYRMGHWSWIPPWGWTWIDDAPWGFAPFHYGRWARIGPHWAWVPGRLALRPVYAPALVVFVGGSSGSVNWNISISSGSAPQPAIGWFPLAPGEAFLPVYPVSPRYITQVNQNIVVNNTVNVTNIYRYQRQPAAVTVVSRDDFARGRPVRSDLHTLSTTDLSRAQVVAERSAMPQRLDRADVHERPSPVAAAALPPAAVVARPVVGSRDERRDARRGESREARQQDRTDDRRDDPRAGRPDNNDRNVHAQPPVPVAPLTTGAAGAQPPAARPGPATPLATRAIPAPAPDRSALDAEQGARREQQLQRDQQRRQSEESLGQRALREQAQKNGSAPPPMPDARAAAERNSVDQAQRAQQQFQRDQQRQQRDLIHQQEQQRLQSEESLGQRAMREQAQKQQEQARQQQALQQQQQLRAQQEQQRQAGEQQQFQRDQQRQQRDLIHQQEQQRLQSEESLGQRAMREQAQKQQEQARQQQALQQQQQLRAQQEQQRQAGEQQQLQRDQQRQQRELIHQQELQRRQSEELLGQRALREQAQKQQEQARQQQALQQQQHRAQQEQQRQAHEQQQEQRKEQAHERQQKRQADIVHERGHRPEGGPNRIQEQ